MKKTDTDTEILISPEQEAEIKSLFDRIIVLYNDDHNSFDHVISCLVDFCEQHPHQAEQCAMLVHNKGKCQVKSGSFETLKPIYDALVENDLTVEMQ